jgi:hypothetical protein
VPIVTSLDIPATATTPTPTTRTLLTGLAVSGPLWSVVSLTQVAFRDGFDLTRHPLSMLSIGSLGWLQIANFVIAGVLTVAGAAGLRRVMHGTPGGTWAPRLLGVSGAGLIAAGVFVLDPADGFPIGTPPGTPATMSWHSYGHLAAGTVSFVCLIAACYVLGRHFHRSGQRGRRARCRHRPADRQRLGDDRRRRGIAGPRGRRHRRDALGLLRRRPLPPRQLIGRAARSTLYLGHTRVILPGRRMDVVHQRGASTPPYGQGLDLDPGAGLHDVPHANIDRT